MPLPPTALTDISIQERGFVSSRVRRFAQSIQCLGHEGMKAKGPVLMQPAAVLLLGQLAQHANEYMRAIDVFDQLRQLNRIERTIREIDELQHEADRQQRKEADQ
jgi:hypothetical protein